MVTARARWTRATTFCEVSNERIGPCGGRCGAQLRGQPGMYCEKYPVRARARCRLHGGKSPTGDRHPSFVHGRRSKYVVSRAAYEQAMHDIAIARVLYERAIAAGSTGVAQSAALLQAVRAYAELVRGKVLPSAIEPRPRGG